MYPGWRHFRTEYPVHPSLHHYGCFMLLIIPSFLWKVEFLPFVCIWYDFPIFIVISWFIGSTKDSTYVRQDVVAWMGSGLTTNASSSFILSSHPTIKWAPQSQPSYEGTIFSSNPSFSLVWISWKPMNWLPFPSLLLESKATNCLPSLLPGLLVGTIGYIVYWLPAKDRKSVV